MKYCPISVSRATVYDNKIYACGEKGIYIFDGEEWVKINTPQAPEGDPFIVSPYNLCACNGELWAMCSCHYDSSSSTYYTGFSKLTQSGWTPVQKTNVSSILNGPAVAYNNEIHILGYDKYNNHYKWNGNGLSYVGTIPYSSYSGTIGTEGATALVYNGEIHLLGGYETYYGEDSRYVSTYYNHYKYNGTKWSSVDRLPRALKDGAAVVHDGKIHIFGGSKISNGDTTNLSHYSWDGSTWTKIDSIGIASIYGAKSLPSFEFNGEIRAICQRENYAIQCCWCNDKYWVYERDFDLPGLITLPFFED